MIKYIIFNNSQREEYDTLESANQRRIELISVYLKQIDSLFPIVKQITTEDDLKMWETIYDEKLMNLEKQLPNHVSYVIEEKYIEL
jgi:hypothetical protein